jgi:penicillin-binding protein 1C
MTAAGALLCFLASQAGAGPASLRIFDRSGLEIRDLNPDRPDSNFPAPIEEISPWAVLATLAYEDRRFFEHGGMDPLSIARALWQNARSGRVVSGGSTITQQLARGQGALPRTWTAKVREAAAAWELERRLSKRDILERYLNSVSYGNRCAGIEAASRLYFGKPSRELSLAEAAYLSAIPRSPGAVHPFRRPEVLLRRQRRILDRMLALGWIGAGLHALASREPLLVRPPEKAFSAPHFAAEVRRRARGPEAWTTLDSGLQSEAQDALRSHLRELSGNRASNGAVVAIDNRTRGVLVWVGSRDFFDAEHEGQVDGALALRQPGSALKPFVYGLALSRGRRASDLLSDLPMSLPNRFSPRNYDGKFHGRVRLREALACSYNAAAVSLAETLGAEAMLATLRRAGLDSLDKPADHYGLALALGDGEVSLVELTAAYAALASGGAWAPCRVLRDEPPARGRRVFPPEVCCLLSSILSDNSARAPAFGAYSPFNLPFPMAAKTGTSKDYRDNWAVGYTPEWTAGVWVGNFDGRPMARVSGISGAGPVLRDVAMALYRRLGASPFPRPRGIREAEVCPVSGRLPGPNCPTLMTELYTARNMPRETCPLSHAEARALAEETEREPFVAFPKAGDVFKIDPTFSLEAQQIRLRAGGRRPGAARWSVDGRGIPSEPDSTAWWKLSPGRHSIRLDFDGPRGRSRLRPVPIFVAETRG